ncbi:MAG: VanZ family protein [Sphaerochaetaceae bacterium]|nr:VanZ family protein [Sphaerochaetaceae bacterium]
MQKIIRKIAIVLTILTFILVNVFSLKQTISNPVISSMNDKVGHFIAYFVLSFFLFFCFFSINSLKNNSKNKFYLFFKSNWIISINSILLSTIVGILIEIIQPFFHRFRDPLDVLADFLGSFSAQIFIYIFFFIIIKSLFLKKK